MGGLWDLLGTTFNTWRVGLAGFLLKNSTGTAQIRNLADSEHADFEALTVAVKETGAAHVFKLLAGTMAGNLNLTLPTNDGSPGYVLGTDGAGVSSWVAPSSNGLLCDETDYTQASSSPITCFTPPANAVIVKIENDVESAAGGGNPTLAVGVSGTPARYMSTSQNSQKEALQYVTNPAHEEDGTPDAIIITLVPDSQTFSGRVRIYYTVTS